MKRSNAPHTIHCVTITAQPVRLRVGRFPGLTPGEEPNHSMVIVMIARTPVIIPVVVPVIPIMRTLARMMIHVVHVPAIPSVAIIDHATGDGTGCQNGQEYRHDELLHIESFSNQG